MEQLQGVGADRLLVALSMELLIAYAQTVVGVDSADDDVEILLAGRCILQHQAFLHCRTVGQHTMYGERGEEPALDAVVAEHLMITDVVFVGAFVAVDDDAKHLENGITMAVERRALQGVAVGYLVSLPFLVQLLEGEAPVGPKSIDNPDILVKYL